MQNLDEKKWDAISLDSMFSFERGKEKNMAALIEGNIPLVSARKMNNGIKSFIKNPTKVIKGGNVISLNNDGDGGAGLAYYQPIDFALDTHVTVLHPKKEILPDALLYMTTSISKQHSVFGHGRSISLPRAKRIQNMLPVTDTGEPDYDHMAEYTRQKRKSMLEKYDAYVEKKIDEMGEAVDIPALDEKMWQEFRIGDMFDVSRPAARNKNDYLEGNVPFVASGSVNNGVIKFCVPREGEILDQGGCITVSPVDGSTFYQPMEFLGRGGAGSSILVLRSDNLNLYYGQFVARAIEQTCLKYTYGHMGNKDSIKRERIKIPVNDTGEPDYEYMEQYTKNMMIKKYKQYLNFLDTKI